MDKRLLAVSFAGRVPEGALVGRSKGSQSAVGVRIGRYEQRDEKDDWRRSVCL